MKLVLLGILGVLGVAIYFSFSSTPSSSPSPSTSSLPSRSALERQFAVERIGGWILSCSPREDECSAIFNLERGAKHTNVKGRFGSISVSIQIDRAVRINDVSVKYDDDPVGTFQGVELMSIAVDGRGQAFACRRGGCQMTAPDAFVEALRQGKSLQLEPRGREPVEVDFSGFARVWDAFQKKAASFARP